MQPTRRQIINIIDGWIEEQLSMAYERYTYMKVHCAYMNSMFAKQ